MNKRNLYMPIVIVIEGLIGAGKSSLIEECLQPQLNKKGYTVTIIKEPVDKWKEILPKFYEDPGRWAYHFQTKAFHDRVKECIDMWEKHSKTTDIFICERSVMSDTIFMETLYEQKHITDMEWNHYMEWWNLWERIVPFKPDLFVYLDPSIEEVMSRVKNRNRKGEEGIGLDYQLLLKSKHDKMFLEENNNIKCKILHFPINSDFKNDEQVKIELSDKIEKMI